MQIRMLGPLEVRRDGEVVPLGGRKQRSVLADLLIHHGITVSRDRLIEDLWGPAAPPTAAGTLQAYVSRLRKALGESVLVRDDTGYRLVVESGEIDAGRFVGLVEEARDRAEQEDAAGASALYREALGLWRGGVLGELGDEHFVRGETQRLAELRAEAQEDFFDVRLEREDHEGLVAELQAAVAEEPFRERRWMQLMTALYRTGRQVDALRTYQKAERVLGEELGIAPGADLRHLEEQILLQDPDLRYRAENQARREESPNHTNLRETASAFVGRGRDLQEIAELFASRRLISVVGTGGVGKTRLAIELGWHLLPQLEGGVWDMDLATEREPNRVPRVVAAALQLPERGSDSELRRVITRVADSDTLFILDNCEHVLEAVTRIADQLLAACRGLRIIATSRQPFGVPDEQVYTLEPLPLPTGEETTAAELLDSPAVELFQICGDASHRGFRVTNTNGPAVAAVVRRLDGLPLAIELAAGRLGLLTPNQIADELDAGFPRYAAAADAVDRHSTLRSAIDWSYDLLDDREQVVLRRLGVFAGGFSAEDAALVCSGAGVAPEGVATILDSLAAKSLLSRSPATFNGGLSRFVLLETIRGYALDRLAAIGELESFQRRHAQSMAELAEEAARHFHGREQRRWFDRVRSRHAEMDRALDFATAVDDFALGRRLCRALWLWWYLDGLFDGAIDRIDWFAGSQPDDTDPDWSYLVAARALILSERGTGPEHVGSSEGNRVVEDVGLAQKHAECLDPVGTAHVDLLCGDALSAIGSHDAAEQLLDRAIVAFRDLEMPWAEGWALLRLVRLVALGRGDFITADQLLSRAIAALDQAGDLQLLAYARLALANRARLLGRFPESLEIAREALGLYREVGMESPTLLAYIAESLIETGRPVEAIEIARELKTHSLATNAASWVDVAETREALALVRLGNADEALPLLEAVCDRDSGIDPAATGSVLLTLAEALLAGADWEGATSAARRAQDLCDRSGHPWNRARARVILGEVALAAGFDEDAVVAFNSGLELYQGLRHFAPGTAACCEGLASAARQAELPEEVAVRLGAAARLRDECGAPPPPLVVTRNRDLVSWAALGLGPDGFRMSWEQGEAWATGYLEDSFWDATRV